MVNAQYSVRHLGEPCASYEDEYTTPYLVCRNSGGRAHVTTQEANLVTLVTQSSIDRLDRVTRMLATWPGYLHIVIVLLFITNTILVL